MGRKIFGDGSFYRGEIHDNETPHGKGILKSSNGDEYEGTFN
jgi:hypothetical protein